MRVGGKTLRERLSNPKLFRVARRSGPVAAAIAVNFAMIAGFSAFAGSRLHQPSSVTLPKAIEVTLVPEDLPPPPLQTAPPAPAARVASSGGDGGVSLSSRKRRGKPAETLAPAPDADVVANIGGAPAAPDDGVPAGLRGLMKTEHCGPSSERIRDNCSQRHAGLMEWRPGDKETPDVTEYEKRFGEVVGVEEHMRRAKAIAALMYKPAGALDPAFGD